MAALDTNVVIRLLIGDEPRQAHAAEALVAREPCTVSCAVLMESEWVLRGAYSLGADTIAYLLTGLLALLFWRSTLNVFSMIGLVMLMGLVTKNAILLVDFANHARKAGATVPEALLQAGLIRMRPIIMTTAAMVFGMLPLALALNDGGEIQAPMGRAIIGGVITSTLLTLVVVPILYSYLVRERKAAVPVQAPSGSVAMGGSVLPSGAPADRD